MSGESDASFVSSEGVPNCGCEVPHSRFFIHSPFIMSGESDASSVSSEGEDVADCGCMVGHRFNCHMIALPSPQDKYYIEDYVKGKRNIADYEKFMDTVGKKFRRQHEKYSEQQAKKRNEALPTVPRDVLSKLDLDRYDVTEMELKQILKGGNTRPILFYELIQKLHPGLEKLEDLADDKLEWIRNVVFCVFPVTESEAWTRLRSQYREYCRYKDVN